MLTIGWGGVSRIDLEPAGCSDPECEADHGYTGVLASDDFSLRVSAAADGTDAVAGCWRSPSRSRRAPRAREPDRRAAFVEPAYGEPSLGDVVPAVGRGARRRTGSASSPDRARAARGPGVRRVPGRRPRARGCWSGTPHAAPYLSSLIGGQAPGTAGVPSTTATSLTSLGTALPPGAHGLVGFTSRVPGTDRLLNALSWDKTVDPHGVAAAPDRVHRGCADAGVR